MERDQHALQWAQHAQADHKLERQQHRGMDPERRLVGDFDIERRADEGIDPDDLATFYKVLDQLTRNLEAVDADPAEAFEPLEIQ